MTGEVSQEPNPKEPPTDEIRENHWDMQESMRGLALPHTAQARCADAEPLLLEAFHGRETKLGPEHPHTVASLKQLVTLYESWPKPAEAAEWRARLPHDDNTRE